MKYLSAELKLLLISLAAGLLFATGMLVVTRAQGLELTTLTGDAGGYIMLAENLLTQHAFGLPGEGHFYYESFRSPGYPVFLAALFALTHDWYAVLLIQVLVTSIAPVLLYMLFKRYHERAAWWGSVMFALEPTRLFLSASLLTDALFTCLFLGSLVTLEYGRREASVWYALCTGLLLGLSILVRPIAQFLPLLYGGYVLLVQRPLHRALRYSAVLLCAVLIVVVPWMWRNHTHFGVWGISSVGAANLMLYNAPAYLSDHPSTVGNAVLDHFRSEQKLLPREDALSLTRSAVFTATFREVIRGHEVSYVLFHIAKTIPFFLTDGMREIIRICGFSYGTPPNISSLLFSGNVQVIVDYLKVGGVPILLLVVGSGVYVCVLLLFLYAGVQIVRGKLLMRSALFFVVLVFYFALLTGPVSNARYRNPVAGSMFVVALSLVLQHKQRTSDGITKSS